MQLYPRVLVIQLLAKEQLEVYFVSSVPFRMWLMTTNFSVIFLLFRIPPSIPHSLKRKSTLITINKTIIFLIIIIISTGPDITATAKLLQSCLTLCDPIDSLPPGSPVPGILQARALEWVAISFSNAWKWKVKVKSLSRTWLLATPWTAAYHAPSSMGFSRQEYWSGVPLPSPYKSLVRAYYVPDTVPG